MILGVLVGAVGAIGLALASAMRNPNLPAFVAMFLAIGVFFAAGLAWLAMFMGT